MLVVYELGGVLECPQSYDMNTVYGYSSKSIPIIFLQPTQDEGSNTSNVTSYTEYIFSMA